MFYNIEVVFLLDESLFDELPPSSSDTSEEELADEKFYYNWDPCDEELSLYWDLILIKFESVFEADWDPRDEELSLY